MEKVSYKGRKTNESVLEMVGEGRKLVDTIVQRKKKWIGYVLGYWTVEGGDRGYNGE